MYTHTCPFSLLLQHKHELPHEVSDLPYTALFVRAVWKFHRLWHHCHTYNCQPCFGKILLLYILRHLKKWISHGNYVKHNEAILKIANLLQKQQSWATNLECGEITYELHRLRSHYPLAKLLLSLPDLSRVKCHTSPAILWLCCVVRKFQRGHDSHPWQ